MRGLLHAGMIVIALCPTFALADDGLMTAPQFYRLATRLMMNSIDHDEAIDACVKTAILSSDAAVREEMTRRSKMPAGATFREGCRRLVKGIAAGRIPYTTYRAWMEAEPESLISIPDFK